MNKMIEKENNRGFNGQLTKMRTKFFGEIIITPNQDRTGKKMKRDTKRVCMRGTCNDDNAKDKSGDNAASIRKSAHINRNIYIEAHLCLILAV